MLMYPDPLEENWEKAKGVCALRVKFGPLWSQKLTVTFHQFHQIGLLEE